MSTYYKFICTECRKSGGFYSRQAWGWGNADIISSFKFIMKHSLCINEENNEIALLVIDEHGKRYDWPENINLDDYFPNLDDYFPNLDDYFPNSDDWVLMLKNKTEWNNLVLVDKDYLHDLQIFFRDNNK